MKKILINFFVFALVMLPTLALAANGFTFDNPLGNNAYSIDQIVVKIVDFVLKIASVVVVLFIIYSGFLFVSAQGKQDKIKAAKDTFFWAIIGALIILGAKVLAGIVCSTASGLGADLNGICK